MKVKLLRDCKPFGRTGEIAEVSPDHFEWLTSLGFAVPAEEAGEQAKAPEKAVRVPSGKKAPAKKERGK